MTRPIFRMRPDERVEALRPFTGHHVIAYLDSRRDGEAKPYHGEALGVAWATSGQADELVLRLFGQNVGGLRLVAISTATLAGVELDPSFYGANADLRLAPLGRTTATP